MDTSSLRIVTLFLLTACISLYIYTSRQQDFYDQHSKPAIFEILKEVSVWEKEALKKHLSAEAQQTLTDQQLEQLLGHYRQFGQLVSIDQLTFSRLASALSLFGKNRINYQGDATFSQKQAHINITLTTDNDTYKIYNLTVSNMR
jgi:hypothetical protein